MSGLRLRQSFPEQRTVARWLSGHRDSAGCKHPPAWRPSWPLSRVRLACPLSIAPSPRLAARACRRSPVGLQFSSLQPLGTVSGLLRPAVQLTWCRKSPKCSSRADACSCPGEELGMCAYLACSECTAVGELCSSRRDDRRARTSNLRCAHAQSTCTVPRGAGSAVRQGPTVVPSGARRGCGGACRQGSSPPWHDSAKEKPLTVCAKPTGAR